MRQAMAYRHLASGARRALINGSAGVVVFAAGRPFAVVSVTFSPNAIRGLDFLVDPERLARLDLSAVEPGQG